MFRNRSLAFKLILFFLASSILTFSVVLTYNYSYSREIIRNDIEQNARNLALLKVARIEKVLNAVPKVTQSISDRLENSSYSKEEILTMIRTTLIHNPDIYGMAVAFEPLTSDLSKKRLAPYLYRKGPEITLADLTADSYSYLQSDWYQIPKELSAPQWTEPYFDEGGGNILMTTYSIPFFDRVGMHRRFRGIVTADISLKGLQAIVSSIKILKTGYGFLISKNGTLVTHPSDKLIMNETLFGVAEARGDNHLRAGRGGSYAWPGSGREKINCP